MNTYITKLTALALTILFYIPAAGQQTSDINSALTAIASDPALSNAFIGACIRTEDGNTLAQINQGTMMAPASNMKLITTGAALHVLGGGFRYKTEIGYTGHIKDGILEGNLYIIGGGDPTIGSKDSIAVLLNTRFADWEKLIRNAGIRKIDGHIIGDGRWAEGMAEESTGS